MDHFKDGYLHPSTTKYADQKRVFDDLGVGVLTNAWDGFNCSLFAYGQTGSGKTFSMEGPEEITDQTRGIIPRSFDFLVDTIEKAKEKGWTYELEASYLEIYCEELRDLCEDSGNKKLDILASANGDKHINVANLSSHKG